VDYDAGKRIKDRKRHLLVDTLGLVLGVAVTPASTTERDGAQQVLGRVLDWFAWLRILWVDGGYTGETFANWVKGLRPKLGVEVVKRSDDTAWLQSLATPLGSGSTFGWLMRQCRLIRDYETTETSAEAWIYITMFPIQLCRLA
jgi:transposase